jgi:hypothetical protein
MTEASAAALIHRTGQPVDDDALAVWHERSAIRQFQGKLPRWAADVVGLLDTLRELPRPAVPSRPRKRPPPADQGERISPAAWERGSDVTPHVTAVG